MIGTDNHTIIVGGTDLCATYGLVMLDSSTFEPPDVKTYTVDIPGGNGVIDLTEALTGDVAYERREQQMEFACEENGDWMDTLRKVQGFLHGRAYDYQLSFDPGYTYHGRFAVTSTTHVGKWGESVGHIVVKVTADPYKLKERCAYRLNATGGKMYRFESGRRPVHPTIECENVCYVTWDGEEMTVPAGTYRLNDVVFREGWNELYVNSGRIWAETWADVGEDGKDAMTWAQASACTWDDLQRLGVTDSEGVPQAWADLAEATWADLAAKTWADVDYRRTEDYLLGDSTVYLTYDWEDL